MELYVKVSFWIGVVCLCIRVLLLAGREWPHKETTSLGAYVAATIVSLAFTIWAALALWVIDR